MVIKWILNKHFKNNSRCWILLCFFFNHKNYCNFKCTFMKIWNMCSYSFPWCVYVEYMPTLIEWPIYCYFPRNVMPTLIEWPILIIVLLYIVTDLFNTIYLDNDREVENLIIKKTITTWLFLFELQKWSTFKKTRQSN